MGKLLMLFRLLSRNINWQWIVAVDRRLDHSCTIKLWIQISFAIHRLLYSFFFFSFAYRLLEVLLGTLNRWIHCCDFWCHLLTLLCCLAVFYCILWCVSLRDSVVLLIVCNFPGLGSSSHYRTMCIDVLHQNK